MCYRPLARHIWLAILCVGQREYLSGHEQDRRLVLMASFGDLPTEVAQKCVEFLEFGHLVMGGPDFRSNVPGRIPRVRGPGDALYASHCDRASVVGQLARPRQGALLCGRGGANSAGMGQQVPRYQLPEAHT